ncbi:endolytic transglycosylase MltG [Dermacoccus barathri]|uniref:Endolytic murein transglycosylase n=1 Tax=Dermacoccus barathri TaxID=322601 RepID=A0ABN2BI67_9MICO
MGSSPRDRLFGRAEDEVDPSQAVRREGERGAQTRAALPKARKNPAMTRRERRDRDEALREAERRREAGETSVDYNPNRRRGMVPLVLALVLVLVGGTFAWRTLGLGLPSFQSQGGDYDGAGEDETVEVKINKGDAGSTIGSSLVEAGVTKSTSAFVEAMAANPKVNLTPGTYKLRKKQSAESALTALQDPKNRVGGGIVIQEGLWQSEIFAKLSKGSGRPVSEYEKVTANQLGLPKSMNGKLEGWLFPSTYDFDKSMTAKEQLQAMVKNTKDQLNSLNVRADQLQEVLTKASIVQAESPAGADDGKVARVIENRLDEDMPLQMDSSVHYIIHKRGTVTTSDEDRQSDSPYNTYKHKGLPPTPYNSPGAAAIKAAANPTPGPWKYFVTVNQETGETLFSETYDQQLENEKKFREWCQKNPGKC